MNFYVKFINRMLRTKPRSNKMGENSECDPQDIPDNQEIVRGMIGLHYHRDCGHARKLIIFLLKASLRERQGR